MPRIVASSSPRNMIEMNLQTSGTACYFHDVVSGTEVARSKPAPDTFLLAAEKLHSRPQGLPGAGGQLQRRARRPRCRLRDRDGPRPHAATDEIRALYTCCCKDLLEVRDLLLAGKL